MSLPRHPALAALLAMTSLSNRSLQTDRYLQISQAVDAYVTTR
jgi:hypothetical protein